MTDVRPTPLPKIGLKRDALLKEVKALLQKKAVYRISEYNLQPGFSAIFFLAPKKTGDWRPIINLRPLNFYIRPKRFRMETLATVLRSPIKHGWATSIDLRDAYLHIPIHVSHHKWLRFKIGGQAYTFRCLPFGLSTAPRVFTRVVATVAAFLRRQGISVHVYLDDWLITAPSRQLAIQHTHFVIQTVEKLGFIVNLDKSNLKPTQCPDYLGARIDLVQGRVRPSPERVERLRTSVQSLFHSHSATAFTWLQVLGLMASMVDILPWCRLHMRPLQLHLNFYFQPKVNDLSLVVPVSQIVRDELVWWMEVQNLQIGAVFPVPKPQVVITTDASTLGWGGHIASSVVSGQWSDLEKSYHINLLELLAVEKSLHHLIYSVEGKIVQVKSDNATTVAYINKQGGTKSPSLCLHTRRLLLWCISHNIALTAVHIPGSENALADNLSRGISLAPTEWSLTRPIAQQVFNHMWTPTIDLFASRSNFQLPVYCSRSRDDRAYAVDAMTIDWTGMWAYAFPPISMIHRVLLKMSTEACTLLLIAPFWPRQPWFPLLLRHLVDIPLSLPVTPDLLRMPRSKARFHDVKGLHLTAWTLSSVGTCRQAFLAKLQSSSPEGVDYLHSKYTLRVSGSLSNGVVVDQYVQIKQLFPK